jgi:hypothetical protein
MKRFPEVKWDFNKIDEAHNFRKVFHGTKRERICMNCQGYTEDSETATPLQNSLNRPSRPGLFYRPSYIRSEKVLTNATTKDRITPPLARAIAVQYRTIVKMWRSQEFQKENRKTVDFTLRRMRLNYNSG